MSAPGRPATAIGEIYGQCPECGHAVRWMRIGAAIELGRRRKAGELPRLQILRGATYR